MLLEIPLSEVPLDFDKMCCLYYKLVGGSNFSRVHPAQNLCEIKVKQIFIDLLEKSDISEEKTSVSNFTLCDKIAQFIIWPVSSAAGEGDWLMNDKQSVD
jgi:hypothetical protein